MVRLYENLIDSRHVDAAKTRYWSARYGLNPWRDANGLVEKEWTILYMTIRPEQQMNLQLM